MDAERLKRYLNPLELEPIVLTREEIIAQVDESARMRLGISGRRLVRAWRRGHLPCDLGHVHDLLMMAGMLPDNDPFLLPPPRRRRAVR